MGEKVLENKKNRIETKIREIKRDLELLEGEKRQKKVQSLFLTDKIKEKNSNLTNIQVQLTDLGHRKETAAAELAEIKVEVNQAIVRQITLDADSKKIQAELMQINNDLSLESKHARIHKNFYKLNTLSSKKNELEDVLRQEKCKLILIKDKISSKELIKKTIESKLLILIRDIETRKAEKTETIAEINQINIRQQLINSEINAKDRNIYKLKNDLRDKKVELDSITLELASVKGEDDFKRLRRPGL